MIHSSLGASFTTSQAIASGLTKNRLARLKSSDLLNPMHGVYVVKSEVAKNSQNELYFNQIKKQHLLKATAFSARGHKNHFFTHKTAAVIWGLPIRLTTDTPLSTGCFKPHSKLTTKGVVSYTFTAGKVDTTSHLELPVLSPASTWVVLATVLDFWDAVALGDGVLHHARIGGTQRFEGDPLATKEEILDLINVPYRRSRKYLLKVLKAMTSQSASAPESFLRLKLIAWGYEPEALDFDIYDRYGVFLGCSEIAFPSKRIVFEYEGDHHRSNQKQWFRDIEKYNKYADEGWRVIRVTQDLLYRQASELRRSVDQAFAKQI